jgi:hypothetical protein
MFGAVVPHEADVVLIWSVCHPDTSIDGVLKRPTALCFILCPMVSWMKRSVRCEEDSMRKPSQIAEALHQTGYGRRQVAFRTFRLAAGMPLYFATTLAPKKSGRPADGPEILTPQWLRQYGSPVLFFPASEARDLLIRLTGQQFGRWATASRPRLLRFLTTRDLAFLDRATLPEEPMNLSLLSAEGISRNEVLLSDLGLNGFVSDFRVGRPNKLPSCLVFELMDPVGSIHLDCALHFPHPLMEQGAADPEQYSRWLADDPTLPPPSIFEIGPVR